MKKNKDCKIIFATIIKKNYPNTGLDPEPFYDIGKVLGFIKKLKRKEKFLDLKENKFCFISSIKEYEGADGETIFEGLFTSARNEFRPDLIDKKTGTVRPNPKELSEGDINKTHFVIKVSKSSEEVYCLLEKNHFGITINNVVNYLIYFNRKYLKKKKKKIAFTLRHFLIARKDFRKEIDRVARTTQAEVTFNKKLLGDKFLSFSNRTGDLKEEVKLVAKASRGDDIKEFGIDLFNKFKGQKSEISRLRISGSDFEGNDIVLDTSFMSKVEFVFTSLNPLTGEVITKDLLKGMSLIAEKI